MQYDDRNNPGRRSSDRGEPSQHDSRYSRRYYDHELEEIARLIERSPEGKGHAAQVLQALVRVHGEARVANFITDALRANSTGVFQGADAPPKPGEKEKDDKPVELSKETQIRFRADLGTVFAIMSALIGAAFYVYKEVRSDSSKQEVVSAEVTGEQKKRLDEISKKLEVLIAASAQIREDIKDYQSEVAAILMDEKKKTKSSPSTRQAVIEYLERELMPRRPLREGDE